MLIYLQMLETPEEKITFEQLYRKYRGLMYHIAYNILHNESDAEDAVHQAFVSIIQHFKKITDIESPQTKAFCVIIVERKALTILRSKAKIIDIYDIEQKGVEIPLPGDSGLADSMSRLPAKYREVLLLRFYFGYSPHEIANIFHMSHAAVKKLIWRAKIKLATLLKEDGNSYE